MRLHPCRSPGGKTYRAVAPGERWDTLVEAVSPGKWLIHCHVLPHAEGEQGMFGLVTMIIVE